LSTPFLNVSSRIVSPLGILGSFDENDYDERGLLGLAFHPEFSNFESPGYHKIYTYTSEPVEGIADFTTVALSVGVSFDHQSVIAEWTVSSEDENKIDTSSRREIMRIDQPQFNHNAGKLEFGPDGYLYIALGDGGSANDDAEGHGDEGNGQNIDTVHGSILRIDPLSPNETLSSSDAISSNGKYRVPVDNPMVGIGGLDEIFAYGFRNPFKFSFDPVSYRLIVADVGQNNIEEIDIVESGKNYGWNIKEGTFRFVPETGNVTSNVSGLTSDLVDPVAQYDHDEGSSIIGGFIYRGNAIPDLYGKYVFGDFSMSFSSGAGRLFYAELDTGEIKELVIGQDNRSLGLFVKGFGIDAEGEIYVLASSSLGPFGAGGKVLKITQSTQSSDDSDCFIATAAYGSSTNYHIAILREFRDRFLLNNFIGRAIISFYYKHSPELADLISINDDFRAIVRFCLFPFVGVSWVVLKIGFLPIMVLMLLGVIGLIDIVRTKRKSII
ncbi:PQQ-dependent sugar dehydrogenase, partial [Patescibacteria group bacterium]|nr:PQQ-dependent sugar dehydrogenase [Patescibacteria group bacterium]